MNGRWKKGQASPNPTGRPKKKSSELVRRHIERFVEKNMQPKKLQAIFDKLSDREKGDFLCDILPYAISKKPTDLTIDNLTDEQLNELYREILGAVAPPASNRSIPAGIQDAEVIKQETNEAQ